MRHVPPSDIVKHIHGRIAELKEITPVIEVEDILKSLHESYPEAGLRLEDVAQFVFTAASIHDVGLVLPGQKSSAA